MNPTFLDYLAEVTIGDYLQLHGRAGGTLPASPLPEEIVDWLEDRGYKLVDREKFINPETGEPDPDVGEGAYSYVFIKNPNDKYVLKVARPVPKLQKTDPWIRFVQYARKSNNPHLPRIPSFKQWKIDDRTVYLAMIERLHPLEGVPKEKFSTEDIPILALVYLESGDKWLKETIERLVGHTVSFGEIDRIVDEFIKSDHPFAKIWRDIRDIDGMLDLHAHNVMMRLPEGTFVITDPLG